MSNTSLYGHPVFINGFQPGATEHRLTRIQLSKKASDNGSGKPYDEAWLQRLIMRFPSLLPVNQIEPVFHPLVPICIELPMPVGFLDNLLITPKGDLVLVECKLWRNPEARRKVIAQVIDYATDLSTWTYDKLQQAVQRAQTCDGCGDNKAQTLYQLVVSNNEIDEAAFHDAVSRNLSRGRFLLLIVGDGIQEGVEEIAEFLQRHAGFHFTLALVELALYEKSPQEYFVQPRVLIKTVEVVRNVVSIQDGRIAISPPAPGSSGSTGATAKRTSITEERYFEQLEQKHPGVSGNFKQFLDNIIEHELQPEFGTDSIKLQWTDASGKTWNLGTITSQGPVWTDILGTQAKSVGLIELRNRYLEDLAKLAPEATVKKGKSETARYLAVADKSITIDVLLATQERRDGWIQAIENFQAAVNKASAAD